MNIKKFDLPLTQDQIESIQRGDIIELCGTIYTARDAAHKRMCESLLKNENLPIEINNCAVYYCGPTPTVKGEIIGSCGPTTSARMDDYTPQLLDRGLKIMIGKGNRSQAVIDSIIKNKALYLVAVGGAGALMKKYVTSCQAIAYKDLGCEAIHRLTVKNMQLVAAIDSFGNTFLK